MKLILGYALLLLGAAASCDDEDDRSENNPEHTGDTCLGIEDCYPDADHGELRGEVVCLDKVDLGYCTHTCTTDADCCAADGECETGLPQICSPYEDTNLMLCFLSCESPGGMEESEYCRSNYGPDYNSRSSGGGNQNRKVCVPGGPACGAPADCPGDFPRCCLDDAGVGRFCYTDVAADGRECL